jgi:hypothetical protein
MNLQNSHNDMTRFSFFIDVIDNQSKATQAPLGIHKSNVAIIVMLSSRARRTQSSKVLLTMLRIASLLLPFDVYWDT